MEKVIEKVMESHGILKLQKVRTLSYPSGKKYVQGTPTSFKWQTCLKQPPSTSPKVIA